MNDKPPREIVSRRSRPAKAPLSRDVIVSTALGILKREGLTKLSLRRVAVSLDTGPASLYVYVKNLDDLHSLMLDEALAAVESPAAQGSSWRHRLKALLLVYLHVLLKRPGLAQVALSTIATGPNSLRIWELLLGLLREGGVEDAKAVWSIDLLTLYVTAIAAEQDNWRAFGKGFGPVMKALSAISPEQFPLLASITKDTWRSCGSESRLHWALDAIIDGIKGPHRLQPRGAR